MRRLTLPLILGLSHGVADGAAGLLLGGLPRSTALEQVAVLVLLYNVLAFGGQPLMGLLVDQARRPRAAALAGLLLLAAALLVGGGQLRLAVALAGLGSAAFHVGGGALALNATRGRATGPGLFAAPGVVGLAAGGALAATGHGAIWPFLLPLLALACVLIVIELPYASTNDQRPTTNEEANLEAVVRRSSFVSTNDQRPTTNEEANLEAVVGRSSFVSTNDQRPTTNEEANLEAVVRRSSFISTNDQRPTTNEEANLEAVVRRSSFVVRRPTEPLFEGHDIIMLVLLAGIALRSAVWSSLQFLLAGRIDLLLALAVAAAAGKILGGLLADQVGWRRWTVGALALAAPLLALGGDHIAALLAGVALLQSATPACLVATARMLPGRPATAAGLALGLAIAIGGVPPAAGLSPTMGAPPIMALLALAAALALWWAMRTTTDDERPTTNDQRLPTTAR